jgi:hypothetical protein
MQESILTGITTDTDTGIPIGVPGTRIAAVTMTDGDIGIASDDPLPSVT